MAKPSSAILIPAAIGITLYITSASVHAASLQEAIQQTLKTNPQVLTDVNERKARAQEVKQARGGYFPTVDLTLGYGKEKTKTPTINENLTREEKALELRQMLFDGFATSSEVDRQKARLSSAAHRVNGTAENTALRAAEVYLDVLRRREIVELSKVNLASHQSTYDKVKARSKSGVGSKSDLHQAEGRRALARTNLIAAQSNLQDAMSNYLRVVGTMPDDNMNAPATATSGLPTNVDEAVERAVANHPTLKSAEADVTATNAQHRAAKHAFFPRFDLELGRRWDENLDGVRGDNDETQAMVRMRYNLFKGGSDVARRQQTAHLITEATEVRNNTYRQVVESMRLSWTAYRATDTQMQYLKTHYDASKNTRDAYNKQFSIGKRSLLDLLDSENELFEAKRALINGSYDRLFAIYRIHNAMGSLMKETGAQLADSGESDK